MCTATLLCFPDDPPKLRLVASRDELHTRRSATPPGTHIFGSHTALLPIDPSSGGTWVGVNDTGLIATLLNLNLPDMPELSVAQVSRGGVIPAMMMLSNVEAAVQALETLPTRSMLPFRLLVGDSRRVAIVRSDGKQIQASINDRTDEPIMLTSSGLGDHRVEAPRRALFEDHPPRSPSAQDAFHKHRWPEQPHLSIAMKRDDARTVSRTVVELSANDISMRYTPIDIDGREGQTTTQILTRSLGVWA